MHQPCESYIEYIVQLVVFTPCLDVKGLPQLHHVFIYSSWGIISPFISSMHLLARRNGGIVQWLVWFDEAVEHGFPSVSTDRCTLSFHCLPRDSQYLRSCCCLVCTYKSRFPPSVCATMERSGLLMSFNESLNCNAIVLTQFCNLLVFSGWNDLQGVTSGWMSCDELHDERKVVGVTPLWKYTGRR